MKYTVEGVSYTSKKSATEAAGELHNTTGRAVQIQQGDSTLGETVQTEWIGLEPLVPDCDDLEPVDRSERLAQRREPEPGTSLPQPE